VTEAVSVGRRRVRDCLDELVEAGAVSKEWRGGGDVRNVYTVADTGFKAAAEVNLNPRITEIKPAGTADTTTVDEIETADD